MTDRQPLDFPRITAIAHGQGRVDVTINGVEHMHEGEDDAHAVQMAMDHITRTAQEIDRPVKVTAQFGSTARDMVVDTDGSRQYLTDDYGTIRVPWYRKPGALLALCITALVLISAVVITSVSAVNHRNAEARTPSPSQTATTLDPSLASETQPTVSLNMEYVAYQTDDSSLNVVKTQSGQQATSDDLTEDDHSSSPQKSEILPNASDGFLIVTGNQYRLWTPADGLSEKRFYNPSQQVLVTRQGQNYLIPRESASRPDKVQYITTNAEKTYESPAEKASFLGIHDGKALWAHLDKGTPEVITAADPKGKDKKQGLSKPSKDAKLTQWLGLNNEGEVLTIWKTNGADTLVVQGATSNTITHKIPVNLSNDAAPVFDATATTVLAGNKVIDAHSGQSTEIDPKIAKSAVPRVNGFSSTQDKSDVWLDTDRGVSQVPSELKQAYARFSGYGETWVGTTSNNHIMLDPERK